MSLGIDYFYRNHPLATIQAKASLKTRAKMYQWIADKLGGVQGLKVLDHGSTPDTERLDSNCFIKWFIRDGANTYASSPENIKHLMQTIPQLTVIDWKELETSDFKFDFIMSSAVIEHVGSDNNQLHYISNLLSHAKSICITTPNRYHWLEFHTKLPLIHWLPKKTHRSILKLLGFKFWAQEHNLNLLSERKIIDFIDQLNYSGLHLKYSLYRPKFLGMTSNLVFLICSDYLEK
jgi:2-polyprenyl-3-methyl-5-hydroxy-6-metoxy-1,4-benzoquinol methylase